MALLIIDMINDLDFPEGSQLLIHFRRIAPVIARLRDAAEAAGVPVIYVNDNYDQWHADAGRLVEHCLAASGEGRDAIERVRPRDDDYFVAKPRFSGFYATNLPVLLPELGVDRLILTGVATDICVLFTAADAHMRQYGLWVPRDAVASNEERHRDWALGIMAKSMQAETRPTDELTLEQWLGRTAPQSAASASRAISARLRSTPQR